MGNEKFNVGDRVKVVEKLVPEPYCVSTQNWIVGKEGVIKSLKSSTCIVFIFDSVNDYKLPYSILEKICLESDFDLEKCEKDGWKCEVTNDDMNWFVGEYQGTNRNGSFRVIMQSVFIEAKRIRNVKLQPVKPLRPTKIAIHVKEVKEKPDRSYVLQSYFNTEEGFDNQYDSYSRIELPWPWTPEHQKQADKM